MSDRDGGVADALRASCITRLSRAIAYFISSFVWRLGTSLGQRTVGAAHTVWCPESACSGIVIASRAVVLAAGLRLPQGCDGMTLAQSQPPQEILESDVLPSQAHLVPSEKIKGHLDQSSWPCA